MMSAPAASALGREHGLSTRARAGEHLARLAPCADLQEFPAENILERLGEQLRFGAEQCAPERALPPLTKRDVAVSDGDGSGGAAWHDKRVAIL